MLTAVLPPRSAATALYRSVAQNQARLVFKRGGV
jgi:hypothetical protein